MNLSLIEQGLQQLRLTGMVLEYAKQSKTPNIQATSFDNRLSQLIEAETHHKDNKRINYLIKKAQLRYSQASLEDIIYTEARNIERLQINKLASCDWIKNHHNLLITGPTGTGKSWLACAFAKQACRQKLEVRYTTAGALYDSIELSLAGGTLHRLKRSLVKTSLLVIDDLGLIKASDSATYTLLEILDQQSMNGSVIVTSQYPSNSWHDLFDDPTLADAILDRVIHNSYSIELQGESMRKMNSFRK